MSPLSACYSACLCKISRKSNDRLLSYGQKVNFQYGAYAIFNFLNFHNSYRPTRMQRGLCRGKMSVRHMPVFFVNSYTYLQFFHHRVAQRRRKQFESGGAQKSGAKRRKIFLLCPPTFQ